MKNKKSFTLIELLVVIAVLAGFMALLVPNFMQVRIKSRDVRRKGDLKAIQKALELYKQNQTIPAYPATYPAVCTSLVDGNGVVYMQKVPIDPLTQCNTAGATNYYYQRNATDLGKYLLYACLENRNDPDVVGCPSDFATITGLTCTSNLCYQLTEP
ncbi:MAG: prepilin-type N-terminal cleavage/methylation domain-containing protein [bacterium]